MKVLSTFLESSLNFLSNNLKKYFQNLVQSGRKVVSKTERQKDSLKKQSRTKSTIKLTWSEEMKVLSTFLESSLNFLSNNLKKHYKIWYSRGEKWCQRPNARNTVKKDSQG